jgi:predicted ribonuclease YlaK
MNRANNNTSTTNTNNIDHKGLKHVVVCDTNVFLSGTKYLWRLLSNDTPLLIGVPFGVVKDLEDKRNDQDAIGKNAREILNALDKRQSGTIIVQRMEDVPPANSVLKLGNDDLIIRYAAELAKSERSVVAMITGDTSLRVKARGYPNELVLFESPEAYLHSLKPNR